MTIFEETLRRSIDEQKSGDKKAMRRTLHQLIPERISNYHESLELNLLNDYSDAIYKILFLELDEEEDESIELAEIAYIGFSEGIKAFDDTLYEKLKKRIILLHYFSDFFADSIIDIFLQQYRQDNLLLARNLALDSLAKMQLSDISYIEQNFGDKIEKDEQLIDVCNNISLEDDITVEQLSEASIMHKVLQAYLKVKYKK